MTLKTSLHRAANVVASQFGAAIVRKPSRHGLEGTLTSHEQPLATGPIDRAKFYDENGYIILRGALPLPAIDELKASIAAEVETCTKEIQRHPSGKRELNRFIDNGRGAQMVANALMNPHEQPELPSTSKAILSLLCSRGLSEILESIDRETNHTINQTLLFFTPPGTDLHIDGWSQDTSPPGWFHTLWFPLEPVTLRNGPICIVPWKRGRVMSPIDLGVPAVFDDPKGYVTYHTALNRYIRENHPHCVMPQLDPGDLVIFTSLTPHGTMMPYPQFPSRLAVQALVHPSSMKWGHFQDHFKNSVPDAGANLTADINDRWRVFVRSK